MVAPPAALLVVAGLSGWIQDAPETLGEWTYGFGALMAFLELSSLVGLPAPFEVGVVLSGAVAGEGEIALPPLILFVWLAATAGESVNFATGDRIGRPFLDRHGSRFRVTPARLAWIDERFDRRGGLFVLIGRFIPFVRSSMPFVAGASHMTYRSFLPWSIGGNLLWAAAFCSLGYVFYESADEVADRIQVAGALIIRACGGGGIARVHPPAARHAVTARACSGSVRSRPPATLVEVPSHSGRSSTVSPLSPSRMERSTSSSEVGETAAR